MDLAKFNNHNIEDWVAYGRATLGAQWNTAIETILRVGHYNPNTLPSYKGKAFSGDVIQYNQYLDKWIENYTKGFKGRPSKMKGNPGGTVADSLIKMILGEKVKIKDDERLQAISEGHSLMMTTENLVGSLLEEYLSTKLEKDGWFCCWGSSLKSIDFCRKDNILLQIKNSDNSENSSSVSVRKDTDIKKWFRRFSKTDKHNWSELNELVGRNDLSEEDFRDFVVQTLRQNPDCLVVDNYEYLLKLGK
ncbi:SinI family restriction endonuclease [Fibrivirga algicola]|uniref:SinI family restriction endonuclease n=1 Tax=Fibrivirga algicola TaxID=2950420 RepID=A0ABX0QM33_9BACT|nr:SinI family restriction endonuclease [Fibrivirga algicola]NID13369.1 SinI family restriction endonuclease [Fibrivirga algicola]